MPSGLTVTDAAASSALPFHALPAGPRLRDAAGETGLLGQRAVGGAVEHRDRVAQAGRDVDARALGADRDRVGLRERPPVGAGSAGPRLRDAAGRAGLLGERAVGAAIEDGDGIAEEGRDVDARAVGADGDRVGPAEGLSDEALAEVAASMTQPAAPAAARASRPGRDRGTATAPGEGGGDVGVLTIRADGDRCRAPEPLGRRRRPRSRAPRRSRPFWVSGSAHRPPTRRRRQQHERRRDERRHSLSSTNRAGREAVRRRGQVVAPRPPRSTSIAGPPSRRSRPPGQEAVGALLPEQAVVVGAPQTRSLPAPPHDVVAAEGDDHVGALGAQDVAARGADDRRRVPAHRGTAWPPPRRRAWRRQPLLRAGRRPPGARSRRRPRRSSPPRRSPPVWIEREPPALSYRRSPRSAARRGRRSCRRAAGLETADREVRAACEPATTILPSGCRASASAASTAPKSRRRCRAVEAVVVGAVRVQARDRKRRAGDRGAGRGGSCLRAAGLSPSRLVAAESKTFFRRPRTPLGSRLAASRATRVPRAAAGGKRCRRRGILPSRCRATPKARSGRRG